MPLNVRLAGDAEAALQLHDDAYYRFLHPWFLRIREAIGKYVDLYGDVEMHEGAGLPMLARMLAEARSAAEQQPATWQVHVGTQLRPVRQALHETVRRVELLQTITALEAVVNRALAQRRTLVFCGD